MHVTIHILTTAIDVADAVSRVDGYLETENFYDSYSVLEKQAGTLDAKRAELLELQAKYRNPALNSSSSTRLCNLSATWNEWA